MLHGNNQLLDARVIIQDPLHRRINFKLKPQFAQVQTHSKGKKV